MITLTNWRRKVATTGCLDMCDLDSVLDRLAERSLDGQSVQIVQHLDTRDGLTH